MTRDQFNDLVRQLSRKLFGFAFRILRNQEEAEDAVQEVLLKLWKMEKKLDEYKSIEALATTMIKNYSIDQLRRGKHIVQEEFEKQDFLKVTDHSPYEQLEWHESNDILLGLIDKLPEIYKVVIRLREIDDFSYEEIAKKTEMNVNALRVILSRARKMIRDEYNKYQYERR
jgi:RNA polymerase sigma factor (sigma-70 family)